MLHQRELLRDSAGAVRASERDGLLRPHDRGRLVAQGRTPKDLRAGGRHHRSVRALATLRKLSLTMCLNPLSILPLHTMAIQCDAASGRSSKADGCCLAALVPQWL